MDLKITNIFFGGGPVTSPQLIFKQIWGHFYNITFYIHLESVFIFFEFCPKWPEIYFLVFFEKSLKSKKAYLGGFADNNPKK